MTPAGWQFPSWRFDHEICSTVSLFLLLIQEGQLSVSGERMCTKLVNRLEDKACPVKVWLTDCAQHDPIGLSGSAQIKSAGLGLKIVYFCLYS